MARSSGQFLDHYGGDWKEGARFTLFPFPLVQALQGFWHSAECRSTKQLRPDGTPPIFRFPVESLIPDEWATRTLGYAVSQE